ncbi:CRISPR-associated endonuclease Cas1 [Candidatus Desantisbacteria bacterium CG_4_10_14_0_8_um_filter_39_17]|uniref:CRISPR-associated endonuclease Cas1 n=1 Tax=Candidatus Desantisbacteria bacterium CG_4_10_14_0_8_um_filter_39_17 TaxID=1974542 RepID=A0A2H9P9D2_9BACT|nr:MAG: CRISPR-associated endonuclease Cas1 [Candidatus Desantisbacteria bacterium CG_4_10_14_0_8_um_filter_39_17]
MQLVINTYGSYLRKKDDCFLVKNDDREFEVSAKKIESIIITTGAYLSTDAIKFAMENNIDVVFLDEFGNPYGRVWYSKLGSTTLIRRRQLEIAETENGLELAKSWIIQKFDNQIEFLKRIANSRPEKESQILEYVKNLEGIRDKLGQLNGILEEKRGTIMGLEGSGGRVYFGALSFIVPERFEFEGRSRNPAKDEFNCFLNYSYGVLYSMVEKACILAGLDPYIGFIHTDNYNKKSLVFDIIDMFRIYADQTVVFLFSQRQVKKEHFDEVKGGFTLNKEGKAVLIEALNKTLDKTQRYKGRNIKNRDTIQFECHRIANDLIKSERIPSGDKKCSSG